MGQENPRHSIARASFSSKTNWNRPNWLVDRSRDSDAQGAEASRRVKIRPQIQDAILVESRRRCCICFGLDRDFNRKKGQIAHLDGNSANARASNLVFLCWDHHDEFDSRSSQSKNLTQGEVRQFRDELRAHIAAVFGQEANGDLVQVDSLSRTGSVVEEARKLQSSEVNDARPESPSQWLLRYEFEHANSAWLGPFSNDSRDLLVVEKGKCSRLFRDGIESIWTFEIPDEMRETFANSDDSPLASFIADGHGASVYARSNGDLSVAIQTFSEDEHLETKWETLKAHCTRPSFAGFALDGSVLVTGDEAGELLIWDWPTRRKTHKLPSLVGPVSSAHLSGNDRVIVTGRNGSFEIFELATSRAVGSGSARVKGSGAQVRFSLNPAYLVADDDADRFDVLETATLKAAPENTWALVCVSAKSDASECVAAIKTAVGTVLVAVREPSKGFEPQAFEALSPQGRRVSDYEVSMDGERIAIMVDRKSLMVWERALP